MFVRSTTVAPTERNQDSIDGWSLDSVIAAAGDRDQMKAPFPLLSSFLFLGFGLSMRGSTLLRLCYDFHKAVPKPESSSNRNQQPMDCNIECLMFSVEIYFHFTCGPCTHLEGHPDRESCRCVTAKVWGRAATRRDARTLRGLRGRPRSSPTALLLLRLHLCIPMRQL